MNREWHAAHRLPRNASLETRLEWHRDHAENCSCRESPEHIKHELEKRGMAPRHKPPEGN